MGRGKGKGRGEERKGGEGKEREGRGREGKGVPLTALCDKYHPAERTSSGCKRLQSAEAELFIRG